MNSKPKIRAEIEEVLLKPRIDITKLSCDQFVQLSRADLLARGWDPAPPILRRGGVQTPSPDIIKERVGLQFGFRSNALVTDILKFQAYDSQAARIDVGVYVLGTTAFQNRMKKETGNSWTGLSFNEVARKLPGIGNGLKVPICLIGLEAAEEKVQPKGRDINLMSPSQIKEAVFAFLERTYGQSIDQNVRLMGMGRGVDVEFDGIMRLDDRDIIIEIEVSIPGLLRSRVLADSTRTFTKTLQEYQRLAKRQATLRFIFLGEFSPIYINKTIGQKGGVHDSNGDQIVTYGVYPFERLGLADIH